jgi:predicted anti-sigma-YlaC factor YlaD
MDCKKIKELLMSDYLDGEAACRLKEKIQAHIKVCAGCRDLEQLLLKKARRPFQGYGKEQPPERIWQGIKEAIAQEEACDTAALPERAIDFLRNHLFARKPAFALLTVSTFILLAAWFSGAAFYRQRMVKEYITQQSQYLVSLNGPVNGDLDRDMDFGTSIEQYFF